MVLFNNRLTFKRIIYLLIDYIIDRLYFAFSYTTYPLRKIPKSSKQKKILLMAHRALMVDYIAEIPELLKDDERIEYYLLRYYLYDRKNAKSYIKELLPYPSVNRFMAYLTRWDLIVTSSFPQRHLIKNVRGPTLCVEHGIAAGGIAANIANRAIRKK